MPSPTAHTPAAAAPSTPTPRAGFLRAVMAADAVSSAATGALQLAGGAALAGLLGLSAALLLGTGLFFMAYAAACVAMALPHAPPRRPIAVVAVGNAAWAAGCLALLASGWLAPTALGTAFVLAQAVVTGALSVLQAHGLRATHPHRLAPAW